nr:glycerol-3-phosphate acyltransferase [Ktedonobacterales bacterium]
MSPVEVILRFCGAGVAGYLLGSLPSGVIVSRILRSEDPRAHGSGKTGATNVLRTLGPVPALLVAVLDAAKGVGAVLLARYVFFAVGGVPAGGPDYRGWAEALAGFAALLG